jgi:hypothetical protein
LLAQEVADVYIPNIDASISEHAPLGFAEVNYQKLLAWMDTHERIYSIAQDTIVQLMFQFSSGLTSSNFSYFPINNKRPA